MKSKSRSFTQYLQSASDSTLWILNYIYDCGCITTFKIQTGSISDKLYTLPEKLKRNKSLKSKLLSYGFKIISLVGKYPESGKSSVEEAFFVVDYSELGLLEKLTELADIFDQETFIYCPKRSVFGVNMSLSNRINTDPVFTLYRNETPTISFYAPPRSEIKEELLPQTGYGIWALHLIAKQYWTDVKI